MVSQPSPLSLYRPAAPAASVLSRTFFPSSSSLVLPLPFTVIPDTLPIDSSFFPFRIGTAVILFDIHITEPDLQHLLGPVIDDPDDVFGGVSGAALCRGRGGGGVVQSDLRGLCRRGG